MIESGRSSASSGVAVTEEVAEMEKGGEGGGAVAVAVAATAAVVAVALVAV